jgi:hypothetical protein
MGHKKAGCQEHNGTVGQQGTYQAYQDDYQGVLKLVHISDIGIQAQERAQRKQETDDRLYAITVLIIKLL